ncbi:MAG: amino acid ABC transporter permease, partial [Eubacteriales bacterium]|nr:amino acid ABC transporter permease [Eubacteriales bacterium]
MPTGFGERIIYILQKYGMSFLRGAGTTMIIALVSTLVGCVIGFAVGIVQTLPADRK